MLDFVPSFLRTAPTPPTLRFESERNAAVPLILNDSMRTEDELANDPATLAAQDRFDRLFASL